MQARDLMSTPVATINAEATVGEAARMMLDQGTSCLPVADNEEHLVGILTRTDFGLHPKFRPPMENVYSLLGSSTTPEHIEEVSHQVTRKLAKDVMSQPVFTVNEDTPVEELTSLLLAHEIHRLPVLRDIQVVGIITQHDFLKLIASGS